MKTIETGTELYQRMLAHDYKDDEIRALMEKTWGPTPWMIDVYTGSLDDERIKEMKDWCREKFGEEAWPLRDKPGNWQTGTVTLFGWTWMGFATDEQMNKFIARWPAPKDNLKKPQYLRGI